jgi:hypothetical protein
VKNEIKEVASYSRREVKTKYSDTKDEIKQETGGTVLFGVRGQELCYTHCIILVNEAASYCSV